MSKIYNRNRHLELLKQKFMGIDTKESSHELLRYSCAFNNHLDWEARECYLGLIEDFKKGEIKDLEFCFNFDERGKKTDNVREILESNFILLSPHEKSLGFSDLIEEIFDICSTYIEDAEFRDKNSELEFRSSIEKAYSQLKQFLQE